jgi:hypothetical protein
MGALITPLLASFAAGLWFIIGTPKALNMAYTVVTAQLLKNIILILYGAGSMTPAG